MTNIINIKRKISHTCLALSMALLFSLTGCSSEKPQQSSSSSLSSASTGSTLSVENSSSESAKDIQSEIDALWAKLDTTRLPQRKDNKTTYDPQRQNKSTMPTQVLFPNDDTVYMLANCVQNLLGFSGNSMRDFDAPITEMYDQGAISAVLYRIGSLQLDYSLDYGKNSICTIKTEKPNHIVSASLNQYVADGHSVSEFYDSRDVDDAIHYLFGEQVGYIQHIDSEIYSYLGRSGIYVRQGDFGGPWYRYPQLASYTKTADGYTCDVVVAFGLDKETPCTIGGIDTPLTKDNFASLTKDEPLYRYNFTTAEDGHLVLTSLKTIREGTAK